MSKSVADMAYCFAVLRMRCSAMCRFQNICRWVFSVAEDLQRLICSERLPETMFEDLRRGICSERVLETIFRKAMLNMSCAELMCERSCFFALIHEHHTHIDVHGRHGCVVVQLCTSPSVFSEDRLCPCSICARWSSSLLRRPSWSRIRFAGVRIAFARNCRTELGFCFALLVAARLLQSGRPGPQSQLSLGTLIRTHTPWTFG